MAQTVVMRLAQLRAEGMGRIESMVALQAEYPDLELTIPDEDDLDEDASQTDTPAPEDELDDRPLWELELEREPDRWLNIETVLAEPDDPDPVPQLTDELIDLAALLARRPAWMGDALCQEYPDLPWFPERGQSTAACKAVCERCLVAAECDAYAVEEGIREGVWAGEMRRRRKVTSAA